MKVIHITGHQNTIPIVLIHIDTRFTLHFGESNQLHHLTQLEIPLSATLLESIERLVEQAVEHSAARTKLLIACISETRIGP